MRRRRDFLPMIFASYALVSLLSASTTQAVEAYEPPPLSWLENSWGTSFTGEYFVSSANYDVNRGSSTRLPSSNYFNNLTSHVRGRYGFTKDLAFFLAAGFANTNTRSLAYGDQSSTSATDLGGGLDFVFWRRWVKLIFEAQGGYPVDRVDRLQTKPLTSDGVPFGRAGVFAYRPFRSFRLSGYVGFDFPFENLSKKILYQVYGEIPFRRFVAGGGINGSEAITSDGLSFPERIATATNADGGSWRFYSFEPGIMEARAWIGFRPDQHFLARVGYAKTINGVRSAEGQSILFSLAYNAKDLFGPSVETLESDVRSVDPGAGFQTEIEKTDQTLFQDEPKPKRPRAPKVPPASESLDQTERMLDKKR